MQLIAAIETAKQNTGGPTIIEVKTVIGFGSPNKSGKSDSHGAPLGTDEVVLTKASYAGNMSHSSFQLKCMKHLKQQAKFKVCKQKLHGMEFEAYKNEFPELAEQFVNAMENKLPENFATELPVYEAGTAVATRSSSGDAINAIAKKVPSFFGGSADLAGSNKTTIKGAGDFFAETPEGRNIWFGVREFAMGAAINGMALHGGLNVFGGTFFVFSDYVRPAIRLSALMGLPVTYVFTHDSIAVGEDGPTHEPIEHLASLRAMPNFLLFVQQMETNQQQLGNCS